MDSFEREILIGLQKNDLKAFDLLFKTHYSSLCHYAYDIIGNAETAKEIVHDLYIKIWESRKKLVIKSTFKGYLFRSVHNRCLNYLRDSKNSKTIDYISTDDEKNRIQLLTIEIQPDIIEKLFSMQLEAQLEKAMEALPEQCRNIFYMSRFDNLTYPEIAARLNLALSTVKTQMQRAISKLQEALDGKL